MDKPPPSPSLRLPVRLTQDQVKKALEDEYGATINLLQAARIANRSTGTIRNWISQGLLDGTFMSRGRVIFWRDAFVQRLMTLDATRRSSTR